MKTMKVAIAREVGGPDLVEITRLPIPDVAPGRVLVKVSAAAVNLVDVKMIAGFMGTPFPIVPGRDVAGTVATIGEGVEGFTEGDAVFGSTIWGPAGSFAEYVQCDPAALIPVPERLTMKQAAALVSIVFTAQTALFDKGKIGEGTRILIAGASGGVGGMAVQLAKKAGAYVIGVASSKNREYVLGLGADEFVAYDEDPTYAGAKGVDVAFDMVGGATTALAGGTLRPNGRLVSIANFETPKLPNGTPVETLQAVPHPHTLRTVGEGVVLGEFGVEIEATYPLDQARAALVHVATGRVRGKLVVTV